jgi:hypothetical protein
MFEEYNQVVKTAKELSREDFESFEFQPKKKVREMFEKLMTATTEEFKEEGIAEEVGQSPFSPEDQIKSQDGMRRGSTRAAVGSDQDEDDDGL